MGQFVEGAGVNRQGLEARVIQSQQLLHLGVEVVRDDLEIIADERASYQVGVAIQVGQSQVHLGRQISNLGGGASEG
jgi:hypothetical protein